MHMKRVKLPFILEIEIENKMHDKRHMCPVQKITSYDCIRGNLLVTPTEEESKTNI